jgi:hypothetical protein
MPRWNPDPRSKNSVGVRLVWDQASKVDGVNVCAIEPLFDAYP